MTERSCVHIVVVAHSVCDHVCGVKFSGLIYFHVNVITIFVARGISNFLNLFKVNLKCCVDGCKINAQLQHRFPNPKKDWGTFQEWLQVLNNKNLIAMKPEEVYNLKTCHCHFKQQQQ